MQLFSDYYFFINLLSNNIERTLEISRVLLIARGGFDITSHSLLLPLKLLKMLYLQAISQHFTINYQYIKISNFIALYRILSPKVGYKVGY